MKFPKLEIIQFLFNRPEPSGAFSETIKEYVRFKIEKGDKDPLGAIELEVVLSLNDIEAERKDKQEPPLRVKTES